MIKVHLPDTKYNSSLFTAFLICNLILVKCDILRGIFFVITLENNRWQTKKYNNNKSLKRMEGRVNTFLIHSVMLHLTLYINLRCVRQFTHKKYCFESAIDCTLNMHMQLWKRCMKAVTVNQGLFTIFDFLQITVCIWNLLCCQYFFQSCINSA